MDKQQLRCSAEAYKATKKRLFRESASGLSTVDSRVLVTPAPLIGRALGIYDNVTEKERRSAALCFPIPIQNVGTGVGTGRVVLPTRNSSYCTTYLEVLVEYLRGSMDSISDNY